MSNAPDMSKSLEQLENDFWEDCESYPTGLVERCHRYRKIPLKSLTPHHIRLLIGQNIGLPFLVPMAVALVEKNPLKDATHFPGDLLKNLISCDLSEVENSDDIKKRLKAVCLKAETPLRQNDPAKLLPEFRAFRENG